MRSFTLSQVNKSIQQTLDARYKSEFWVQAEMNKLNHYPHSGHCFPELVEKKDGRIIAQMKATLWKNDFERINNNFKNILKEPLKDGIKILFLARINFDLTHGLSLKIIDIDPAYTLGDLEKEKLETITRLRNENIFDLNKKNRLPLLPQRIAIISVESSKGYADFLRVLEGNQWNYQFFHMLFPSLLQGEKAIAQIIIQLNRIKKVKHHFDVVAIIRGGGGDIGLSCYNDFTLSKAVAEFPLPVLTGIGHATNETIVELVAHTNAITPTKIAEFMLQQFHNFAQPVKDAGRIISGNARKIIADEKTAFHHLTRSFRSATINTIKQSKYQLGAFSSTLSSESRFAISSELKSLNALTTSISKNVKSELNTAKTSLRQLTSLAGRLTAYKIDRDRKRIEYLFSQLSTRMPGIIRQRQVEISSIEKNIFNLSPENVLRRGYSITLKNGKAVNNPSEVKQGDMIETIVSGGSISSNVTSTKKEK